MKTANKIYLSLSIAFSMLLLAGCATAQNVTPSPWGAYYKGSDPIYSLPYYTTPLQAGQTYFVLQRSTDTVYSDSTNATDALIGSGLFTPLNTTVYEVTATNYLGGSVTNIFITAEKKYYGSFYGIIGMPSSVVTNGYYTSSALSITNPNSGRYIFYKPNGIEIHVTNTTAAAYLSLNSGGGLYDGRVDLSSDQGGTVNIHASDGSGAFSGNVTASNFVGNIYCPSNTFNLSLFTNGMANFSHRIGDSNGQSLVSCYLSNGVAFFKTIQ